MAKFSAEGEGEGESVSSPRKRSRAEAEFEGGGDPDNLSISIDLDVLDCSICMDPLISPVFQCENGHIACSACCTKLKNKCHTCSWPIGYSRCLAIEKVIESIKISCRNTRYGCKEKVNYTHKTTHEEKCIYVPCPCPISGCTFLGSSEQLSFHISSKHWSSAIRFRFNCPFPASLDKNEPYVILHSEDGHLFLLSNSIESMGNAVSLTHIGPSTPTGGFSYDLIIKNGGRSLRLQSFTKSIRRQTEVSPSALDFLLVPYGFSSCFQQLNMEVCIWSTREME